MSKPSRRAQALFWLLLAAGLLGMACLCTLASYGLERWLGVAL